MALGYISLSVAQFEYDRGTRWLSSDGVAWSNQHPSDHYFKIAGEEQLSHTHYTEWNDLDLRRAQSFTPQSSNTVTEVTLRIGKDTVVGDPPPFLYVVLRATDGEGKPTGAVLSKGKIATSGFPESPWGTDNEERVISLSSYYVLIDVLYCYVIRLKGSPDVTTQAVRTIRIEDAIGHGTIVRENYGSVTEHGVCWNTTGSPTTADNKTEEGAGSEGAFSSQMTGLDENQLYYLRAYATNSEGTSYGEEVEFTTKGLDWKPSAFIWSELTKQHYLDFSDDEREFEGELVGAGGVVAGQAWIEGDYYHQLTHYPSDERRTLGTPTGQSGTEGYLFVEGLGLHFLRDGGNEASKEGVLV